MIVCTKKALLRAFFSAENYFVIPMAWDLFNE